MQLATDERFVGDATSTLTLSGAVWTTPEELAIVSVPMHFCMS